MLKVLARLSDRFLTEVRMKPNEATPAPERREEERHPIYTLLPVTIIDESSRASVACRVEDVSPEGIGVITGGPLAIGRALSLVTLRERFALEVAWCVPISGSKEFRCGLRLTDQSKDLGKIFASFFERLKVG